MPDTCEKPTAHTLLEERANTPSSSTLAKFAGGFGLGTMLHFVPFQCSITWPGASVPIPTIPAAHASVGEKSTTPSR